MQRLLQALDNDKEVQELRKIWKEKKDTPFPGYNYDQYAGIDDLFKQSDVISLHCLLTEETFHVINEKSISIMKDNVVLINTGRGALIDSAALVNALKKGKIGGAALDVYEEESQYFFNDWSAQTITDDILARLLTFPNVLITSHQAFLTENALSAIAETTLSNIRNRLIEDFLDV